MSKPIDTDPHARSVIDAVIAGYRQQPRSPVLKTPASQGLPYQDVTFPSEDGVPLEAWFIPREGSDRLIISNHPRYFSRYGFPSHLPPWNGLFGKAGNDFEVDFNLDYRILHEAGYNVLTYDLRNLGHSGAANGGISTGGRFESRDVIGSLAYARSHPQLGEMTVGLFSRCLGCNATLFAMQRKPEVFADVRCLIGVQPLSVRRIMQGILRLHDIAPERIAEIDQGILHATSFSLDAMSPIGAAASVVLPTLLMQVRNDVLTRPDDVQSIFDAMPAAEKSLVWIEDSTRRWDGYTRFARQPAEVLAWLDRFMRPGP
jgi:hypothetical protein